MILVKCAPPSPHSPLSKVFQVHKMVVLFFRRVNIKNIFHLIIWYMCTHWQYMTSEGTLILVFNQKYSFIGIFLIIFFWNGIIEQRFKLEQTFCHFVVLDRYILVKTYCFCKQTLNVWLKKKSLITSCLMLKWREKVTSINCKHLNQIEDYGEKNRMYMYMRVYLYKEIKELQ